MSAAENHVMRTLKGQPAGNIALGTMLFGTGIPENEAFVLLDSYISAGGRQIDTARSYASWLKDGAGASERTIGHWLQQSHSETREKLFLGTKGCLMPRGYNATRGDLRPSRIRSELSESLEALHTDYIDLYWLHRDEEERPLEEILETVGELMQEKKIRYFGVSNWKAERILEAQRLSAEKGLPRISASQIQFGFGICTPRRWGDDSVVCMDKEEYTVYRKLQIPVYAYSAQSEGYFARYFYGEREKISAGTLAKYDYPENRMRAQRMKELDAQVRQLPPGTVGHREISPAFVSCEYCLRAPFPVVFLHGGANRQRLLAVMGHVRDRSAWLSEKEWEFLMQDGDF